MTGKKIGLINSIQTVSLLLFCIEPYQSRTLTPIPEITVEQCNVDPSSITVSGFSAGAMMATQFHFAHSSEIGGVGIIAGVPYFCSIFSTATCTFNPTNVNVTLLVTTANQLAANDLIDPVDNIRGDKVLIFHGQQDVNVYPESGRKVEAMYANYGADIQTEFSFNVPHGFPTTQNCGYNGAFNILNHMYGGLTLPADNSANLTNLLTFNQAEFFPLDPSYSSMDVIGFVYVPTACRNGERCRFHITFHGCKQYRLKVSNTYATYIGTIEVAEVNNIIVLFPQTFAVPSNPDGCWDWWGYTSKWFPSNRGDQIAAIHRMLTRVVNG